MSEKKKSDLPNENAVAEKPENKPERMKTVYTHGKKFRIPASEKLENFLKRKYPNEYK